MSMEMLRKRFGALGTALVSDVLDEAGWQAQTLDPALGLVAGGGFCGPAICVRGERIAATRTRPGPGASLPLYALPTLARAGGVLVFATGGFRGGGVAGELLARDLASAGAAGLLTDGLVRDRAALGACGLPVAAAGAIPLNGARRIRIVETGAPVHLPGPEGAAVTIAPGDLALADADGAIIIPGHSAEDVLAMAEELADREDRLMRDAPSLSPAARAEARAARMDHMTWLRQPRESMR